MMKALKNLSIVIACSLLVSSLGLSDETAPAVDVDIDSRFNANIESIQLFSPPLEMSADALQAAIRADLQNASRNLQISYSAPPLLSGSEQYYDAVLITDSNAEVQRSIIRLQQ